MNYMAFPGLIRAKRINVQEIFAGHNTKAIKAVRDAVREYYKVDERQLNTTATHGRILKGIGHNVIYARQYICYLLKKVYDPSMTLQSIAAVAYTSGDHANVIYSIKAVQNRLDTEEETHTLICTLKSLIEEKLLKL